jgi:hypothetical protein
MINLNLFHPGQKPVQQQEQQIEYKERLLLKLHKMQSSV